MATENAPMFFTYFSAAAAGPGKSSLGTTPRPQSPTTSPPSASREMILYYDCDGSMFLRDEINDRLAPAGFQWIDCTGGQAAFEDGDLEAFGKIVVEAARELDVKIHNILRMGDPGLGLTIDPQWLIEGLKEGVFQRFQIPDDVYAGTVGNLGNPYNAGKVDGLFGGVEGFHERKGDGYTWSQTDEEVELRFPVSQGVKTKYVKVKFAATKLKVAVSGQTLLCGELGGTVDVDGSTFTIEDAASPNLGKELCVTLGKKEDKSWPFVVQKKK